MAPHVQPPEDLEFRLAFETLLFDLSARLVAVPDDAFPAVVGDAMGRVVRFFGADRGGILAVDPVSRTAHVLHGWYAEPHAVRIPPELNLAPLFPYGYHVLADLRQPFVVASYDDVPPEAAVDRASHLAMGVRSTLNVPIAIGTATRYILNVDALRKEVAWPTAFVPRLQLLGEIFGNTFERRRISAELRTSEARLEAAVDAVGLGFYLMTPPCETADLDDRARAMLGIPPDQEPRMRSFWLEHVHPDDRDRVIQASRDVKEEGVERISRVYRYEHPTRGLVWLQHTTRTFERDASGRPTRVAGVLQDITEQKRAEEALSSLSRRLIQAQEAERALLARELHDDVTQRMAVLAIELGRAESGAPGGEQSEILRTVREGLVRLSEDIHSLAYRLHPSVLEELGLAEALRTECERRGRRGGIDITLDLEPVPAAFGKDAALCLYRVAQEALNNVTRHARAHTAQVVLRQMDGGLLLAVRDDGVGFDPGEPRVRGSLGLVSMQERLRLVNGTLDVESAPGHGTSITAWAPADGGRR